MVSIMSRQDKGNKASEMKRFIGILLAIILCLYALISNRGGAGQIKLPMSFGIGNAIVVTGSMEPALPVNSYIIVKSEKEYRVDDIVAFESGKDVVVHRIVKINGDEIITKGDANNIEDPPITLDKIKGKVIFHVPYLGYAFSIFKTPFGGMILVFAAFAFLVFSGKDDDEEAENKKETEEDEKN